MAASVKALHAQESLGAAQETVSKVIDEPWRMRLDKATDLA